MRDMLIVLAEEAVPIKAQRAAAEIAPAGEGSRSALTNLASAPCSRYRRTRQLTDLNAAIDAAREAAETTPPAIRAVQQRLAVGQLELDLGVEAGGGGPLPVTSSRVGTCWTPSSALTRSRGPRSAVASLRTTCSGVCSYLVGMLMSSLPGPNARPKMLSLPGRRPRACSYS